MKYDIYDGYETNIKSGEKSIDALRNDLSLTVIQYYFDYLSLEAKKDAKQKEIEQLTAQEDRIGRFYNAGTTTEDELQKIVSRLQNAIVELQEIELNIMEFKGLKIGIMGCIVNGPGEMADADYGYVGAARGKVSLYRRKECIERNIPEEEAVDKLLQLIRNDLK